MGNPSEGVPESLPLTEQDVIDALVKAETYPFKVEEFLRFNNESNREREAKVLADPENTAVLYRANMENSIKVFSLLYKVKAYRNSARQILETLQQSALASPANRDLAKKIKDLFDGCALDDEESIKDDVEVLVDTFDLVESAFEGGGREVAKPLLGGLYNAFIKLNKLDPNTVINTLVEWNPEGDLTKEEFESLNRRRKILSNAVGIMTASGIRHDLNKID